MRNEKITPLYERLSRDDELQGESNSYKPSKADVRGVCPPEWPAESPRTSPMTAYREPVLTAPAFWR